MTFKKANTRGRLRHQPPTVVTVKPRRVTYKPLPNHVCRVLPFQVVKVPEFMDTDPSTNTNGFDQMLESAIKELLLLATK